jgi:hypothetical protein
MNNNINSWVPYGVTDFATPAAKAAARSKAQNEEDLKNKLEQSKQIEAADSDVQALAMVGGVLDLTTTLAKYTSAKKKAKKTESATKTKDLYAKFFSNEKNKETLDSIFRYSGSKAGLKEGSQGTKKFIANLRSQVVTEENKDQYPNLAIGERIHDEEMLDYLYDSDVNELIRIKENRAADFVNNESSQYYRTYVRTLNDEDSIEHAEQVGNKPSAIREDFKEKVIAKLETDLRLHPDLLASKGIYAAILKQAQTLAGLGGAEYKIEKATKTAVKQQKDIDTAKVALDVDGNSLSNVLSTHITDTATDNNISIEEAKTNITARYLLAIDSDELDAHELAAMQTGLVKHDGGKIVVTEENQEQYPGFKVGDKLGPGSLLLNEGQWKVLNSRLKARYNAITASADAQRDEAIDKSIGMASAGQLTTATHEGALRSYLASGGLTTDDKYKKLAGIKLQFQSKGYYKAEKGELLKKIENGKIESIMSDTSQIQNLQLRGEFEAKLKDYNIALKALNSSNDTSFLSYGKGYINKVNDLRLVNGQGLDPGSMSTAQVFIANTKQRIFTEEFFKPDANVSDPNFQTNINQRVEFELDSLGINLKWNDPNKGILTPDNSGKFPLLTAFMRSNLEGTTGSSVLQTNREFLNVQSKLKWNKLTAPGKNEKDQLLNTPNLAVDTGELVATGRFISWDPETKTYTGWPQDILTKAEVYGIQPSILVSRAIRAIENRGTKEDKQILEHFNLGKLADHLEDNPSDVKLRRIIENSDDKDLLTHYEKIGLNKWMAYPKLFTRLTKLELNFDKELNPAAYQAYKAAEKSAAIAEKEKRNQNSDTEN